ncbi:MAG TPA: glycosyltransferase family 2 protein [Gemmatimonadales bacterium]|nr:glycosyltransferase family 2 protein [Gemmatimonadales bacterium]
MSGAGTPDERAAPALSASVVVYRPSSDELRTTLRTFRREAERAVAAREVASVQLVVVDNGSPAVALDTLLAEELRAAPWFAWTLLRGHGNVGYGRGHNIAAQRGLGRYHLVLNPDVELVEGALAAGLRFLRENPDVVLAAPCAVSPHGVPLHLCKRYPSVLVLALRGFAPRCVRARWDARLGQYEMRHLFAAATPVRADFLASGCFLLVRSDAFIAAGGFSPRFFLYFEDSDLSLRMRQHGALAYLPAMRIVHHGGNAARKGWWHVCLFTRSAVTFFRAHGWRLA